MPSTTRICLAFVALGAIAAVGCKSNTNATPDASVSTTSQIIPIFIGSAPADTSAQTPPPPPATTVIINNAPPQTPATAPAATADQPGGAYGTGVTRGSVPSGRNTPIPDTSQVALPPQGGAGAPNVTYGGTNAQTAAPTPIAPIAIPPAAPQTTAAPPPIGAGAFGSGSFGGTVAPTQNSPTTGGAGAGGVAPGQAFGGAGAGGAPTGQASGGAGGGQ